MARRTHRDIRRETIVDERTGVLNLAGERVAAMRRMVKRGQLDADEAELKIRIIRTFAGDIAIGLHVDGDEDPEVRHLMRPVVKSQAESM